MNIVNIIHIGDQTYRMDELPEEKRIEIGKKLNQQALESIGYKMNQASAQAGADGQALEVTNEQKEMETAEGVPLDTRIYGRILHDECRQFCGFITGTGSDSIQLFQVKGH